MKNLILLLSILIYLLLVSCASSSNSYMDSPLSPKGSGYYPMVSTYSVEEINSSNSDYGDLAKNYNQSDKLNSENQTSVKGKQIIIYDAQLYINTELESDSINNSIIRIAEKYNGYTTNRANNYIIIRVKADLLKNAINDIEQFGEITQKIIQGNDLTLEFSDLNVKMDNLEKSRQRYLELLAKAENVETALKVEKELERLLFEIERTKGRLETISHLEKYSTISIYYKKEHKPGPISWVFKVIYSGVKWLFVWD